MAMNTEHHETRQILLPIGLNRQGKSARRRPVPVQENYRPKAETSPAGGNPAEKISRLKAQLAKVVPKGSRDPDNDPFVQRLARLR